MRSTQSLLDEILTDAREGPSLGSLDRCTTTELIEAKNEFPYLREGYDRPNPTRRKITLERCTIIVHLSDDPETGAEVFTPNPDLDKTKPD